MTADINAISALREAMKGSAITRLIAEQNVTVEYSPSIDAPTWSENSITYPFLMCMSDENIHLALVFREVGLFLLKKQMDVAFTESAAENVVLHAMAEQLIVSKYPGMSKTFRQAYSTMLSRGAFGDVKGVKFARGAHRINLYLKLGAIDGDFLELTAEELALAKRIQMINPTDLNEFSSIVSELSERPCVYSRSQMVVALREEFYDTGDRNNSWYSADTDEDKIINDMIDEYTQLSPELEGFWLKRDSIQQYSMVVYREPTPNVINFADQFAPMGENRHAYVPKTGTSEFRKASIRGVDSMAKVFEARKAAQRNINAKVSKTGLLNVNRVVNYRFSDDIFLSKMKLGDAKSHGAIILLDCSGSIHRMYKKMAEQVIVMIEFFRKVGIPYIVYGFGAETDSLNRYHSFGEIQSNSFTSYDARLTMFCNSNMTHTEHVAACSAMHNQEMFGFGATPMFNALSQVEKIAPKFFDDHKVDVRKLILVTDGQPTDASNTNNYSRSGRYDKTVVLDPKTKKTYINHGYAFSKVDINLAILRDRYNIESITIALVNSFRDDNVSTFAGKTKTMDMMTHMRVDGYVEFDSPHKNKTFIVKSSAVDNNMENMNVTADMSAAKAATAFKATMKRTNSSKKFLNILANSLTL